MKEFETARQGFLLCTRLVMIFSVRVPCQTLLLTRTLMPLIALADYRPTGWMCVNMNLLGVALRERSSSTCYAPDCANCIVSAPTSHAFRGCLTTCKSRRLQAKGVYLTSEYCTRTLPPTPKPTQCGRQMAVKSIRMHERYTVTTIFRNISPLRDNGSCIEPPDLPPTRFDRLIQMRLTDDFWQAHQDLCWHR